MKRIISIQFMIICILFVIATSVGAHFQIIIPSDDIVGPKESRNINLNIMFGHPFEGAYMNMEKPVQFGIVTKGIKTDLLSTLKPKNIGGYSTFEVSYTIKKPGDHIFYVEPTPYWEPAEDCYIIHYTKVIVSALGMEEGWDDELGLKTEIIPLTRPYGLYAGNMFQGIVIVDGKPVSNSKVEVEYFNKGSKFTAPDNTYITQIVKTDCNGVFSYCMPKAGWWGFAALNMDSKKIKGPNGKNKNVEIGAVLWVRSRDMK